MREIRFRAWDKKGKKFLRQIYSFSSACFDGQIDGVMEMDEEDFDYPGDIELMQYTGLLDSKGREIYEGDIVHGVRSEQDGNNAYQIIDVVLGVPGGFKLFGKPMQDFTWIDDRRIRDIYWVDSGHFNIPDIYRKIIDIEVIGNIYENPELLEAK